jgi:hypothetical protein
MVQLLETLTRLITPARFERAQAKALVDRYETIKPDLEKLGVYVSSMEKRDTDNTMITTYTVSCRKEHTAEVSALLHQVHIKDLAESRDTKGEITTAGLLALNNTKESYEVRQNWLNTITFVIYTGKYMSPEDSQRLRQKVT